MVAVTRALADQAGNVQQVAYDLTGAVYTLIVMDGGSGATASQVQGNVAHDSPVAGNPLRIGARAQSAYFAQVTSGDVVDLMATRAGALITKADAPSELEWGFTGSFTTTASTEVKALASGLRQCMKGLQVSTITTTVATTLTVLDGVTPVWSVTLPAGAGNPAWTFATPIKSTVGAAFNVALGTTPVGAVAVNAQGFAQP